MESQNKKNNDFGGKTQRYNIKSKVKKPSKHPKLKKVIKWSVILLFLLLLIGGGIIFGVGYQVLKEAKVGIEEVAIRFQNSYVKDSKGDIIAVLSGEENREIIKLKDMSPYLPQAFVAIEDERFYDHMGIDVKRTAGAAANFLLKGSSSYGGSTITQQLIKNYTQEKEDTWQRKVMEMARAYYLEKELSKDQILELYLNLIFMGDTTYGVQIASTFYFSKSAGELDLAESAFLAGINNSPNSYVPFNGTKQEKQEVKERIETRTKTVLSKMRELDKITEEEYNNAVAEVDKGLKFKKGKINQTIYSYHTDAAITQIIGELQKKNDWDYNQARLHLFSGGYTIYTTQDTKIQKTLEKEFSKSSYIMPSYKYKGKTSQASITVIDYRTGHVVGIYGKLGKKTDAFRIK